MAPLLYFLIPVEKEDTADAALFSTNSIYLVPLILSTIKNTRIPNVSI
jgi:hypothetical protein